MFPNVAAIVRSWNKKIVKTKVRQLLEMGVGVVYVMVNAGPDRNSTKHWLKKLRKKYPKRVKVHVMFEGYSWTGALNAAVEAILMENMRRKSRGRALLEWAMPISNEVGLTKRCLAKMLKAGEEQGAMIVGTTFKATEEGKPVKLEKSYNTHYRNTLALLSLASPRLSFNSITDGFGGMEDAAYEFLIRAWGYTVLILDLLVPLEVGVNFNQKEKELRERNAIKQIIAYYKGIFLRGTRERKILNAIWRKMGFE